MTKKGADLNPFAALNGLKALIKSSDQVENVVISQLFNLEI